MNRQSETTHYPTSSRLWLDRTLDRHIARSIARVLPEWIHPQPVALVTVNDSVLDYVNQIRADLEQQDINVLCEFGDHSVGRKIKRSFELKIPNIVIIGGARSPSGKTDNPQGQTH